MLILIEYSQNDTYVCIKKILSTFTGPRLNVLVFAYLTIVNALHSDLKKRTQDSAASWQKRATKFVLLEKKIRAIRYMSTKMQQYLGALVRTYFIFYLRKLHNII